MMLQLSQRHMLLHPPSQHCTAFRHAPPISRFSRARCTARKPVSVAAEITTAEQTVGPVSQSLLGLPSDSSWETLQKLVTPSTDEMKRLQAAARAVESRVGGTAQLAGVTAAGTALPGQRAVIVSRQPDYRGPHEQRDFGNHMEIVKKTRECLVSEQLGDGGAFSITHQDDMFIPCKYEGTALAVVVCGDTSPDYDLQQLQYVSGLSLSSNQHVVLMQYSAAVSLGDFLGRQPALYKLAVRVIKKWVLSVIPGFSVNWSSPCLDLLVLKAFQQYKSSKAARAASWTKDGLLEPAGLDFILLNFLELTAGLNSSTVISWDAFYSRNLVYRALAPNSPYYSRGVNLRLMLRPTGCQAYPIVVNPTNPTHNAAAAWSPAELEQLVEMAQAWSAHFQAEKKQRQREAPLKKLPETPALKQQLQQQQTVAEALKQKLQQQEAEMEALRQQLLQREMEVAALKQPMQQLQTVVQQLQQHQHRQERAEFDALKQKLQQQEAEMEIMRECVAHLAVGDRASAVEAAANVRGSD